MRTTNRVLFLLLVLALAVPAAAAPVTALAQSAGDNQYVDPFQGSGDSGGGNNGNSGNQGGSDTPAQQQTTQVPTDTGTTAGATATDSAQGETLPRTGRSEGWLVVIGVLLVLGGGFTLRRVWPRPH
jgi:LPXTG-motif cell wall-anchored protein